MNNVRKLRLARGLQQKELAVEIGVANATVSDWEHDRKNPSGERLRKLADFFGVSPKVVLGEEEIDPSPQSLQGARISVYPNKEEIVQYVLEKLNSSDDSQKTPEIKIVSGMMGKMTKDQQEQVVAVIKAMFANHPEILE